MKHKFVDFIPERLEDDTLYISIEYDIAKHKCPCGCGDEIVTTLAPSRWKMIYDGDTVSLYPSIGNWTHKCQSHYYITKDQVIWQGTFSEGMIGETLANDRADLSDDAAKDDRRHQERLLDRLRRKIRNRQQQR